jgi:hypothetical protein
MSQTGAIVMRKGRMVSLAECESRSNIQKMTIVASAVSASNAIGITLRLSTHPVCLGGAPASAKNTGRARSTEPERLDGVEHMLYYLE